MQLRRDLRFNAEFLQLIQTLKNIAASQYHMLEREKERFAEFMEQFAGFFRVVDMVHVEAPLVNVATDVIGVVLVTSDSGFMGGLNAGVIQAGYDVQGELPDEKVHFIVVGERGAGHRGVRCGPRQSASCVLQMAPIQNQRRASPSSAHESRRHEIPIQA